MSKKLVIIALLSIFSFTSVQAQGELEATANVGFVIGDASDFISFKAGVALAYMFGVSDEFEVGPEIGFDNYFGKDFSSGGFTIMSEDFGVVPIVGKARYSISDTFNAEAGLGYAVFTGDGGGGEFTFRLGVNVEFVDDGDWSGGAGYESISGNGGSIDAITVRLTYHF